MLITVAYVEVTLERSFSDAEAAKCQQMIDEVTQYIVDQTEEYFDDPNSYDTVPASIKGVACRAVIRGMMSDPTNLKTLTVGDVTEAYGGLLDFPDPDLDTLSRYGAGMGTMYLRHDCD